MRQALLISIWQLSAILHLSSFVRLDGADAHFQVSPEILHWVQAQALAGPLKDIHRVVYKLTLAVCIGSLSCWKVNLLPSLRFWMLWTRFSLRLSQYFGALSFSSTLMSLSVTAAEKQPHSMRLLPAHFTFGMVLCRLWAELVSFKHDVWNWGSSDQRILFLRVWGCFFAHSKCVFMCLTWREDWVLPHRHKAQIGGVLQWCLSFCRFLPSAYMIMELN